MLLEAGSLYCIREDMHIDLFYKNRQTDVSLETLLPTNLVIIIHILNVYFPCLHGSDRFLNSYLPLSSILCQILKIPNFRLSNALQQPRF